MATYSRFRTVDVTTTSVNYELLTDADVKASISDRLGLTSEQYDNLISDDGDGITRFNFQIFGSGFEVSVNEDTFEPLLDESVYSTGDYVSEATKSIRVSTDAINLQFRFNVL